MFKKNDPNSTESLGKTNRIVQATEIKGDIFSEADFRLDGILIGNFTCKGKLVIGAQGGIIGDIKCMNLDIEGNFQGNAVVEQLIVLRATAVVNGNLQMGNLMVETGANVNCTLEMPSKIEYSSIEE